MVPVHIHSLGLDQSSNQPVLLLREDGGARVLPIWIGQSEATAILAAVEGIDPPRPMTHDLMLGVIVAADLVLQRVEITRLEEGTFYAGLVLRGEERTLMVDARPSDSIALALRAKCPIVVAEDVLSEAGIVAEDPTDEEIERFREFLDEVDPEDFADS